MRLYVCGYTEGSENVGIRLYEVSHSAVDGGSDGCNVRFVEGFAGVASPSFGTLGSSVCGGRLLFAASEVAGCGRLSEYRIAADGMLEHVGDCEFEGAAGTCHVIQHPSMRSVFGADYASGSVCSCALSEDGGFAEAWPLVQHVGHGPSRREDDPNDGRQDRAHVHTLSFVPGSEDAEGGPVLAAVDLGTDAISLYRPDADGRIGPSSLVGTVETPAGCGPRIVAYHPTLPVAALICELSCELLLYRISESGTDWRMVQMVGLLDGRTSGELGAEEARRIPADEFPPLSAHAEFSGDGRFLYVSTRGTDTMAMFEVAEDGTVSEAGAVPCGGRVPRHFAISPDQRLVAVANQASGDVVIFRRDAGTGALSQVAKVECFAPSCVVWDS